MEMSQKERMKQIMQKKTQTHLAVKGSAAVWQRFHDVIANLVFIFIDLMKL